MFEVTVEQTFAAGHALRNYHGKCENVHGHNYRVRVTFQGEQLDDTGLLVDFLEVKRLMKVLIDRLDHQFLNDLPPFDILNPSAENMAKYFHDQLISGLGTRDSQTAPRISEVRVWETDSTAAAYRP
ncbi:MAG TPA: 6-carboxytetrahydropterin synthase QueD [Bryobacteraceae bacterium]|nr:6-carboxytetrahydropterin synthase QueD [Bryobacteraceae bacterium]